MISVTNVAVDKKTGMTLGDLATFVQDCMRRDMPSDAIIKAVVGWRSQITTINATERESSQ